MKGLFNFFGIFLITSPLAWLMWEIIGGVVGTLIELLRVSESAERQERKAERAVAGLRCAHCGSEDEYCDCDW